MVFPDIDGIEQVQGIPDIVELPAIFLTAHGRDQYIGRAFDMGAYDYMVKPFSPTDFTAHGRDQNIGLAMTHDQLPGRVCHVTTASNPQVVRIHHHRLHRRLGDGADSPAYIFTGKGRLSHA